MSVVNEIGANLRKLKKGREFSGILLIFYFVLFFE